MAKLPINQVRVTREPIFELDPGLPVGVHRFQLVIEVKRPSQDVVRSEPSEILIRINPLPPVT